VWRCAVPIEAPSTVKKAAVAKAKALLRIEVRRAGTLLVQRRGVLKLIGATLVPTHRTVCTCHVASEAVTNVDVTVFFSNAQPPQLVKSYSCLASSNPFSTRGSTSDVDG
jgi:hypothetical protein